MSLGSGNIAYNSTIGVDVSILNTTGYLKSLPGGGLGGSFDLCLESAVFFVLPDSVTNEKMNFVNTNLTLTVEMDVNFEITTINAERKDATKEDRTLDYSKYVTAYQCTAANLASETVGEYSQGDELKICVTSTDSNIVQVESIKSLTLSQAAGPGAGQEFDYITNGVVADDEITATLCEGTAPVVCHADMQLLGRYFAVDEPGDLTAFGSVELTFDTGRRLTVDVPITGIRGGELAFEDSARRSMEEKNKKKPDDSLFDVKVALTPLNGSGGSDYYGASSLMSGLVANFEITTINAERKDATKEDRTLDYSKYVTAYQCTAANLASETVGEYSQGDELKICVTSTDSNIVQVESIKSLTLSQAAGPGAGQEFDYITNGVVADDEITATLCEGTAPVVCHADMQLLGRYFAVDEPGDLTAFGSVELTFDTGRRLTVDVPITGIRGGELAFEDSARRSMEEKNKKKPDDSLFDVNVALTPLDGSGGSDY